MDVLLTISLKAKPVTDFLAAFMLLFVFCMILDIKRGIKAK